MKNALTGLLIVMLSMFTMNAFGQQASGPAQPGNRTKSGPGVKNQIQAGQGEPLSDEKREAIKKKVETLRILRLTEALKLDSAAAAKLSAHLGSFDTQRRAIQREQMETMRALRSILASQKPDEAKIKESLATLEKNHHAMEELRNKEMAGLKNILTIEQQARYVMFQQEFMREMRGMIDNARGDGPGGRGPGRMRGMGGQGNAQRPPENPR